jgi:hypothetical protein
MLTTLSALRMIEGIDATEDTELAVAYQHFIDNGMIEHLGDLHRDRASKLIAAGVCLPFGKYRAA